MYVNYWVLVWLLESPNCSICCAHSMSSHVWNYQRVFCFAFYSHTGDQTWLIVILIQYHGFVAGIWNRWLKTRQPKRRLWKTYLTGSLEHSTALPSIITQSFGRTATNMNIMHTSPIEKPQGCLENICSTRLEISKFFTSADFTVTLKKLSSVLMWISYVFLTDSHKSRITSSGIWQLWYFLCR